MPAKKTLYKGREFDSQFESSVAEAFDKLGIPWVHHPRTFRLGGGLTYTPDFWLPLSRQWVESKGFGVSFDDEYNKKREVAASEGFCRPYKMYATNGTNIISDDFFDNILGEKDLEQVKNAKSASEIFGIYLRHGYRLYTEPEIKIRELVRLTGQTALICFKNGRIEMLEPEMLDVVYRLDDDPSRTCVIDCKGCKKKNLVYGNEYKYMVCPACGTDVWDKEVNDYDNSLWINSHVQTCGNLFVYAKMEVKFKT